MERVKVRYFVYINLISSKTFSIVRHYWRLGFPPTIGRICRYHYSQWVNIPNGSAIDMRGLFLLKCSLGLSGMCSSLCWGLLLSGMRLPLNSLFDLSLLLLLFPHCRAYLKEAEDSPSERSSARRVAARERMVHSPRALLDWTHLGLGWKQEKGGRMKI